MSDIHPDSFEFTIGALRTGDACNSVFSSLRTTDPLRRLFDPDFAGYCIDAPEYMPAGSVKQRQYESRPQISTFNREKM